MKLDTIFICPMNTKLFLINFKIVGQSLCVSIFKKKKKIFSCMLIETSIKKDQYRGLTSPR